MHRNNVFAPGMALGENALRDALAEGLSDAQGSRTDMEAADLLNISHGTVKNIRNRANTASFKVVSDATQRTGGRFIAPWLARLGLRSVPLDAECDTDAGCQTRLMRLGLKIANALDPASPGGDAITAQEAADMLVELDEFQAHMDRIRALAVAA